ncbi:MAG: hypothetical protein ABSC65_13930 [Acidobacteriaceae bacterium]|jgi:hypothetical protein
MGFQFVQVNGFTPSVPAWSMIGNIGNVTSDGTVSSTTPLMLDLVHQANGYTYTGDNQHTWYIVSR